MLSGAARELVDWGPVGIRVNAVKTVTPGVWGSGPPDAGGDPTVF